MLIGFFGSINKFPRILEDSNKLIYFRSDIDLVFICENQADVKLIREILEKIFD